MTDQDTVIASFRGGARTWFINATYPLARLVVGSDTIRLTCVPLFRWQWTASGLLAVEQVRGAMVSSGIRFVPRRSYSVIFWTPQPQQVLDALRTFGAPISVDAQPAVWFGTGRRR